MNIDWLVAWLNVPAVQFGLALIIIPSVLATHITKTLPVILALWFLNAVQRARNSPEFTNLCARPRKAAVFCWSWGIAIISAHELWPHDAPKPARISDDAWTLMLGLLPPLMVMLFLEVAKRFPADSKWFGWVSALAEWLGSGDYDPRSAAIELENAQTPLHKVGVALRQAARGTKRVKLKSGTEVDVPIDTPPDDYDHTIVDPEITARIRATRDRLDSQPVPPGINAPPKEKP
jgi:hypothetical protein